MRDQETDHLINGPEGADSSRLRCRRVLKCLAAWKYRVLLFLVAVLYSTNYTCIKLMDAWVGSPVKGSMLRFIIACAAGLPVLVRLSMSDSRFVAWPLARDGLMVVQPPVSRHHPQSLPTHPHSTPPAARCSARLADLGLPVHAHHCRRSHMCLPNTPQIGAWSAAGYAVQAIALQTSKAGVQAYSRPLSSHKWYQA